MVNNTSKPSPWDDCLSEWSRVAFDILVHVVTLHRSQTAMAVAKRRCKYPAHECVFGLSFPSRFRIAAVLFTQRGSPVRLRFKNSLREPSKAFWNEIDVFSRFHREKLRQAIPCSANDSIHPSESTRPGKPEQPDVECERLNTNECSLRAGPRKNVPHHSTTAGYHIVNHQIQPCQTPITRKWSSTRHFAL